MYYQLKPSLRVLYNKENKIVRSEESKLLNQTVVINLSDLTFHWNNFRKKEDCPVCGDHYDK